MTLNDVKINHGSLQSDLTSTTSLTSLALFHCWHKKLVWICYCFNFSAYIRYFVKDLIETNVNISNEMSFSDIYPKFVSDPIWSDEPKKNKFIP